MEQEYKIGEVERRVSYKVRGRDRYSDQNMSEESFQKFDLEKFIKEEEQKKHLDKLIKHEDINIDIMKDGVISHVRDVVISGYETRYPYNVTVYSKDTEEHTLVDPSHIVKIEEVACPVCGGCGRSHEG